MKSYDRKAFGIDYSFYAFRESEGDDMRSNLITVWSPTFNNTDTLDSYFAGINIQKTTYPIEVLIVDDASPVNYFEQLIESAAKCRFHVKILRLHKNHHKKSEKHLLVSQYVKGEYVAFCDLSDFWTCPLKLESQLDLIKKSESSWSVTKAEQYNFSNNQRDIMLRALSSDFCKKYISNGLLNLAWGSIPFCTVVMSKSSYDNVIKYLEKKPTITALDHLFLMSAVSEGECAFIEKVTACYEIGAQNSFSKKNILNNYNKMKFFEAHAECLSKFLLHLNTAELYPPTVKYISWMVSQYLPVIREKALNSAVDRIIEEYSHQDMETYYLIFGSGYYSKMLSGNSTFLKLPSETFESLDLTSNILLCRIRELVKRNGNKINVLMTVYDPPIDLEIRIEDYFSSLSNVTFHNFPNKLLAHLIKDGALSFMEDIFEKMPFRCEVEIPTTGSLGQVIKSTQK